jgi:hypothetical protein
MIGLVPGLKHFYNNFIKKSMEKMKGNLLPEPEPFQMGTVTVVLHTASHNNTTNGAMDFKM